MSLSGKKHSEKYKLYEKLTRKYTEANPFKTNQHIQSSVNQIWNESKKFDNFEARILLEIEELEKKIPRAGIKSFFQIAARQTINKAAASAESNVYTKSAVINEKQANVEPQLREKTSCNAQTVSHPNTTTTPYKEPTVSESLTSESSLILQIKESSTNDCVVDEVSASKGKENSGVNCHFFATPAQTAIRQEMDILNSDMVGLYKRRQVGMLSVDQEIELKAKKHRSTVLRKKLARKIGDARRSRKLRKKRQENIRRIMEDHPETYAALQMRSSVGRPRSEESQPLLLQTIVDIALFGSAAHEKRQSDIIRSIKTLDELTRELRNRGFDISRSGIYLRLIPKRSASIEGKRHVKTCPVKLIRAQNDNHSKHIDGHFCTATIRSLEELASVLGPKETFFLSQDDKARISIGLAAAKVQSPMLMHVDYRVSLPDHDWVVAAKHKLIPSVYAAIEIEPNKLGKPDAVGYSGPTYIAIRSGKHSSSTAFSHCLDISKLVGLSQFENFVKHKGSVKPVFIMSVDGGPDENPRYEKTIQVAIHHFNKFNLDGLFIATNAPGRSAFNRVERRMAPLSRELSGVILPHEHFGSHLNAQQETVDVALEKQNFKYAGETLAEIWSAMVIDKHPTIAQYIDPEMAETDSNDIITKDAFWTSKHVQTSQYFLQIVKCNDVTCCSPRRSSLFKILSDGFLPAPIPLKQTDDGIFAAELSSEENVQFAPLLLLNSLDIKSVLPADLQSFSVIPYDMFCPSVSKMLTSRTCPKCHKYFASLVLLKQHIKIHKNVKEPIVKKIRPVRVAAQRSNELMAIILNDGHEDAEWVNIDDIDDGPQCMINTVARERAMEKKNVMTKMEDYMRGTWENVK